MKLKINFLAVLLVMIKFAAGTVNITAPNLAIPFSGYPSLYNNLGDIVILEGNKADFATGTGVTIILSAPAGFEFNAGVGSVAHITGKNISASSISVSSSTITITITVGGTNSNGDQLTISGIQVRATSSSSGDVTRTGGTASVVGDVNGSIHATLSTSAACNGSALPYTENFESAWTTPTTLSPCWSNVYDPTDMDSEWHREDFQGGWTGTSGSYSPSGANSTSHSARFHTYNTSSPKKGSIFSPLLDFSGLAGSKYLEFYYINTSGTDQLKIYLSTDGGSTWGSVLWTGNTASSWTLYNVDLGTSTSSTCMIKFEGTSDFGLTDIGLDEVRVYQPPSMAYSSSTTTQTNTNSVPINSSDQVIIGIEVVTTGPSSPISITSFSLNTTGTTAPGTDIINAKIYYTGTSGTFATTGQFGSTEASPSGSYSITGTQELAEGTNYFWLSYDIPSGATENNYVDAQCTQITVAGSDYAPTETNPAGSRQIKNEVTLGTETTTSKLFPFYNNYENERTQILLLQSELSAATDITHIAFDITQVSSVSYRSFVNFTIKMKHTSTSSFGTAFEDVSGATTVFTSAPYTMPSATGWLTFDINDFSYNGSDNLLIEILWGDNGTYTSTYYKVNSTDYSSGSNYLVVCGYADSETPPSYDERSYFRPNIKLTKSAPTNMAYSASTTTQSSTDIATLNTTGNQIVGVEVVMTGSVSPLDITALDFNTTGTTAPTTDIANAKLYYTGTNATFSTSSQFGSTESSPDGSFSFLGTQQLSAGTNYFWLTYDVPATATIDNFIDAQCTQITVDGSDYAPTETNPAGNRQIKNIITIGDGTTELASYPFYNDYENEKTLILFSASEIGNAGTIAELAFDFSQIAPAGYRDFDNFTIKLMHTSLTSLPSSYTNTASATTVLTSADYDMPTATGWQSFDITDFLYNGSDNLLVEIVWGDNAEYNATTYEVHATNMSGEGNYLVAYGYADSETPPSFDYRSMTRPNIRFIMTAPTDMAFDASTTIQNTTSNVNINSQKNEIVCVKVSTTGTLNPIFITSFNFNTTGSDAPPTDISNARVWCTGGSSVFATSTQFGSTYSAPNGSFSSTSTYQLLPGDNYFWLTFDVTSGAADGNYVDAQCTEITVDGSPETPTVTNPAGNRLIRNVYVISSGGSFNTCAGDFYDSGDLGNPYDDDEDYQITFAPGSSGNLVQIAFSAFSTESCCDKLYIYDGSNTSSPQISGSPFAGVASPGTVTANTIGGELTFRWHSDGSSTDDGWEASISCVPTPDMVYVSSTTTQAVTTDVILGSSNKQIVGVEIVVTGIGDPLLANSFAFNTTGTTNPSGDISNARLYYTSTSSTFSTSNQVGSTVASPDGSFAFNPGQQLIEGTNYFWLTYDINITATPSNKVDAQCSEINISGTPETPSVTNPAGDRTIVDCVCGTGLVAIGSLPYSSTGRTTCGKVNDLTSANTIVCGSSNYYTGEDEIFSFTPASSGSVTITLTSAGTYTGLMLYDGCPNTATSSSCLAYSQSSSGNKSFCAQVNAGTKYYLIVDSYAAPACNPFDISISAPVPNTCPGALGTGVVNVASLPYSSYGRTTCGTVNDMYSGDCKTNICGNSSYYTGEDEVFVFTPGSSGNVTISVTSTGSMIGLMVYDGCPVGGGTCLGYKQNYTGDKSICVPVSSGNTYYVIIDSYSSPSCNPFDITISAPVGGNTGFTCATAQTISSLPFSVSGLNTACSGNDYTSGSTGACSSSYLSGEDYVFTYTATTSECLKLTLTGCNAYASFSVYSGCPGVGGTTCLGTYHSSFMESL
ncbi:MAG: hypothetical protein KKD31_08505 [Bacteroidetes bacterium]|nr:hypothetical protein [Bacteroidota bacterium]